MIALPAHRAAGGSLERGTPVYVVRSATWDYIAQRALVWRVTPSGMVDVVYPHWVAGGAPDLRPTTLKVGCDPVRFNTQGERDERREWLDFDLKPHQAATEQRRRLGEAARLTSQARDALGTRRSVLRAALEDIEVAEGYLRQARAVLCEVASRDDAQPSGTNASA